jgi:hypothetical protein
VDKTISDSLLLLGLDPLSVKFLIAAYRKAPAGIAEIALAAKIKRSTAYLLSRQLIKDGLLLADQKKYGNKVYPPDPEDLLRRISARQRAFRRQEIELEEKLPEIKSLYQMSALRPRVTLFEGNTGLLQVWKDILSAGSEILLWSNQQTENLFFGQENHEKFITERLGKGISIKVLATDTPEARKLRKEDDNYLRKTKILPASTRFSAETYIYDNKIAQLDYNKDVLGIIIESTPISSFHKANFELVWQLIK